MKSTLHRFSITADVLAAGTCAICVILGSIALQLHWVGIALLILAAGYVIGGYQSARDGLKTLIRERELDVDLLMIVAALGAAWLGLWRREYNFILDGALLILIFAVSGALESYAMGRTERSIQSLMSFTPDTAIVLANGQEQQIPVAQLQVGDRILVKPGERIPTDSIVLTGRTTIDRSPITGESRPIDTTVGDEVFAGTLNGNGALTLEIDRPPESSLIRRVIQMVEQAQTEVPPSQQFIERFERGYARTIIAVGLLLITLPPFLLGWSWETTIYRALIFLVVASPCALMAAIMPTLLSGIANGARQGILFKTGAQLELMGKVRAIAFDKTGTLTTGKLQVDRVIAAEGLTESEVLRLAAALEIYSEHPIGMAIAHHTTQVLRDKIVAAEQIQAEPGLGIQGIVAQQPVAVGRESFVRSYVGKLPPQLTAASDQLESEGKTVVWVAQADRVCGLIAVADTLRPEAVAAIAQLKKLGIEQIVMLTGDNAQTAAQIGRAVGVDRVESELLPADKLRIIKQLQQTYHTVAMVGDGINDSPALAQASVGIAMGVTGSDVALETADVVLVADRLDKIAVAIQLGRRSQAIVKQNVVFAIGMIVVLLIANFGGNMTLPLGVIGHEGSTILVTLSGLRLLKR